MVSPRGEAVARGLPGVDEVFVFDKRRADAGLRGILRLGGPAARLRARRGAGLATPRRAPARWPGSPGRRAASATRRSATTGWSLDRGRPFVERSLALVGAGRGAGGRPRPGARAAAGAGRLRPRGAARAAAGR